MPFTQLGLSPVLCRPLARRGYTRPTDIQAGAIPVVLEGRDVMARAQTGTGKTAAFALPILDRLLVRAPRGRIAARTPRALVLTPTRELALQVHEALRTYGAAVGVRSAAIFGGVPMPPQIRALAQGVHVVVATPGRLLDHLERRTIDLSGIEILTLDEADRMLDMGFLPPLKRIISALPRQRQTLLFSATIAPEVKSLAARFMQSPVAIEVAPPNSVAPTVVHRVHPVAQERKRELLVQLLGEDRRRQTLVFCRTKHGSNRLCRQLEAEGFRAAAIHGNKSQAARTRALDDFKAGRVTVLVATDIAARGLDIVQLPLVVNFELPMVAEDYVHRVGRTGRAGSPGHAVSLVSGGERSLLADIQRLLGATLDLQTVDGFEAGASAPAEGPARGAVNGRNRRPGNFRTAAQARQHGPHARPVNGGGVTRRRRPSHGVALDGGARPFGRPAQAGHGRRADGRPTRSGGGQRVY